MHADLVPDCSSFWWQELRASIDLLLLLVNTEAYFSCNLTQTLDVCVHWALVTSRQWNSFTRDFVSICCPECDAEDVIRSSCMFTWIHSTSIAACAEPCPATAATRMFPLSNSLPSLLTHRGWAGVGWRVKQTSVIFSAKRVITYLGHDNRQSLLVQGVRHARNVLR